MKTEAEAWAVQPQGRPEAGEGQRWGWVLPGSLPWTTNSPAHSLVLDFRLQILVERSDKEWSIGAGNGKPLQYSCLGNPMDSMKTHECTALEDELQSYRRKHFSCLTPQGLCSLVRAASETNTMSSPCTRNGPESATSAGALASPSVEWYLETNIWAPGVLTAIRSPLFPGRRKT